nr:DUF192 domain-containing protein [Roseicitreum antarcticum]
MARCLPGQVDLRGPWGTARFSVEIADTPETRNQGLMFRENMPRFAGMLFIYQAPQSASFWMRNTLIPLDMLFVDAAGEVTRIHHDAVPLDETPIFGGDDVLMVLEINGGMARRLGITEGTALRHARVPQAGALWPCDAE